MPSFWDILNTAIEQTTQIYNQAQEFFALQNSGYSRIIRALRLEMLYRIRGTMARGRIDQDPLLLAQTNCDQLIRHLNNQPAYVLYQQTIYHIHFKADEAQNTLAVVEPCIYLESLSSEQNAQLLKLFPNRPDEPLKDDLNETLPIIQSLRLETIHRIHSTVARGRVDQDPLQLAKQNPLGLMKQLNNSSAFILYQQTIHHIHIKMDETQNPQPVVELYIDLASLKQEQIKTILALFPSNADAPLKTDAAAEWASILSLLHPEHTHFPMFNHDLLRPYFNTQPGQTLELPFVAFSAIRLIAYPNETSMQNALQNLSNPDHIPTLIHLSAEKRYLLFGYHTRWRLTEMDAPIITTLKLNFSPNLSEINYDRSYTKLYLHILEKNAHKHYDQLPNQISQLNRIFVGLYFLEQVFYELETVFSRVENLIGGVNEFRSEKGRIHNLAHTAIDLLTHVDIDFNESFHSEITQIGYLLERFKESTESHAENDSSKAIATWSYNIGSMIGFLARHIYAEDGRLDFETLIRLFAEIPQHIDAITTLMNEYSTTITQFAPNIDNEELKRLQAEANNLLSAVKNHDLSQLSSIQAFQYFHLICHVLALLNSTVEQVGHLNVAYQELLFTYMATSKALIGQLFVTFDKIEIESIASPCVLSNFTLQKMRASVHFLRPYIQTLANFEYNADLLDLEDASFFNQRRQAILSLKNDSRKHMITLQWTLFHSKDFFQQLTIVSKELSSAHSTLSQPLHQNEAFDSTLIHQQHTLIEAKAHPASIELIQKYQFLAPILKKIDPNAHNRMVIALGEIVNHIPPNFSPDELIDLQHHLQSYCKKFEATHQLRIDQCEKFLAHINTHADVSLSPCHEFTGGDMILYRVPKHRDIHSSSFQNTLSKFQPNNRSEPVLILIKTTDDTYHTWGFDGVGFVLKPIVIQLIPQSLCEQFDTLTRKGQSFCKLPYDTRYTDFYRNISQVLRSHILYASPHDCSETNGFKEKATLVQNLMGIFDEITQHLWPNTKNHVDSAHWFPEQERLNSITLNNHDPRNQRIANLDQLTFDEALDIYCMYDNRLSDHTTAEHALNELKKLLQQHFPNANSPIYFSKGEDHIRQQCVRLYRRAQPYITLLSNGITCFEQPLIQSLKRVPINPKQDQLIVQHECFAHLDKLIQLMQQADIKVNWTTRALALFTKAGEQFKVTRLNQRLAMVASDPRERYVIKTEILSKKIAILKESFLKLRYLFNQHNREQLNTNVTGVPYPEDTVTLNNPSPYVRFYIDVINTLYYLEQSALGLEKLQTVDDDQENIKRQNINLMLDIVFKENIQPLIPILPRLYHNPHIREVLWMMATGSQQALTELGDLIALYTPSSQHVLPVDKIVQSQGLWRLMNALYCTSDYILDFTAKPSITLCELQADVSIENYAPPTQALTLIKHKQDIWVYGQSDDKKWHMHKLPQDRAKPFLDKTDETYIDFSQSNLSYDPKYQSFYFYMVTQRLHVRSFQDSQSAAKEATVLLEYMAEHKGSYFKLFMSAWRFYQFFKEAKSHLTRLTQVTHQTLMCNLDDIRNVRFRRFIIRLDRMEHRFGLSDIVSKIVQEAFDAGYQGLLLHLKIPFIKKLELACDQSTTLFRIEAERQIIAPDSDVHNAKAQELKKIQQFINAVNEFDQHSPEQETITENTWLFWTKEVSRHKTRSIDEALVAIYQIDVLPILRKVYTTLTTPPNAITFSDANWFWLKGIPTPLTLDNLDHVALLSQEARNQLMIEVAPFQLSTHSALEKINQLESDLANHNAFCQNYAKKFTLDYYDTLLNKYCKPSPLFKSSIIQDECADILKKYLLKFKETLLQRANSQESIDVFLEQEFELHINVFMRKYTPIYQQLDKALQIIQAFSTDIEDDPSMDETLAGLKLESLKDIQTAIQLSKPSRIDHLETLLASRLQHIRSKVLKHEAQLLAKPQQSSSLHCFAWLKDYIFALLSALGLYTPNSMEHRHSTAQLLNSVSPPKATQSYFCLYGPKRKALNITEQAYRTYRYSIL